MKNITFLFILFTSFAFGQVADLAELVSPLSVGEKIPETTITNIESQTVSLKEIYSKKPTVLLFYRGGWCPYCNKHLSSIGEIEQQILDIGYQIVGISPDAPENLKISVAKNKLAYSLYSDASGDLMKAMGIAFKAPNRYEKMLSSYSNNLNEGLLPVPSIFIVDTTGKILFSYVNPDYKIRMNGDTLLSALKKLQ